MRRRRRVLATRAAGRAVFDRRSFTGGLIDQQQTRTTVPALLRGRLRLRVYATANRQPAEAHARTTSLLCCLSCSDSASGLV